MLKKICSATDISEETLMLMAYEDFFNNIYKKQEIKYYHKTQFLSWIKIDSLDELEETLNLCRQPNGLKYFLEQFDLTENLPFLPRNEFPKKMRKKVKELLKCKE